MKNIEIDEELYQFIASNTQFIGESASSILRRLIGFNAEQKSIESVQPATTIVETIEETPVPEEIKESNTSVDKVNSEDQQVESVEVKDRSHENVFNYINKEELAMQRGAVGRFLLILAALYRVHAKSFAVVSEIRGRDRLYFAASKDELAESGSSTKPFQIPDTPYWVVTNSNTTRKKMILTKAAIALGYSESEAEKIRDLL